MRAELSWQGRTGTVEVDGSVVAVLHRAPHRERADVDIAGQRWLFASHRNHLTATTPDGSVDHRAWSTGFWTKRWTVALRATTMRLRRDRGTRRYELVYETGSVAGYAQPGSPAVVTAPDGIPADAAAFVLWVVDVFERRRATPTLAREVS